VTESVPAFIDQRDQRFLTTASVVRQVQQTEAAWFAQGDPYSPTNPWMPFQPAEFLSIVFECAPEMRGRAFLDVGCGPGTKMLLARHFFGFEADGIEISREMAEAAAEHGVVFIADAGDTAPGFYAPYDLIWLYRPFRDPVLERRLEAWIMDEMKPGAILAGGGWEICPADHRWIPVVDDWELRRGAWMKPRPVTEVALP
jgi:SAM-dependent methyltransferase